MFAGNPQSCSIPATATRCSRAQLRRNADKTAEREFSRSAEAIRLRKRPFSARLFEKRGWDYLPQMTKLLLVG